MTDTQARLAVPFLDLSTVHRPIGADFLRDVGELLESGAFTNGPQVAEFEAAFASYCGDLATASASRAGSTPSGWRSRPWGCSPATRCSCPPSRSSRRSRRSARPAAYPCRSTSSEPTFASIRPLLRPRSAHERGRSCRCTSTGGWPTWPRSASSRADHGLVVLEDACQAHGASGRRSAPAARRPPRPLQLLPRQEPRRVRRRRRARHRRRRSSPRGPWRCASTGSGEKYEHDTIGWTARLDTIQAAVLLRKLPLLDDWNDAAARSRPTSTPRARRTSATSCCRTSADRGPGLAPLRRAHRRPGTGSPRISRERGIGTGRHYPEPPHLSKAYASARLRAGLVPGRRAARRRGAFAADLPGHHASDRSSAVVDGVRRGSSRG